MTDIQFEDIRRGDEIRVTLDISVGDRTCTLTTEGVADALKAEVWVTAQGYTLAEKYDEGKSEITLLKRATPGLGAQIVVQLAGGLNVGGTYWDDEFHFIDNHVHETLGWNPDWVWMYLTDVEISDKVKP